jgi:LPS-assembly protein
MLHAQQESPSAPLPDAPQPTLATSSSVPTEEPEQQQPTLPRATLLPPSQPPDRAIIESDLPQSKHGDIYTAAGNVELTYRGRILRADSVTFNEDTGEVIATGHIRLSGGPNDEYINASHATFNIYDGTGRFYDVSGSIGVDNMGVNTRRPVGMAANQQPVNSVTNPVLFTGKLVVKTGESDYTLYEGSFTSCQLPHPDWQFYSGRVSLSADKAHASTATFRLLGIPVLFLPYVTYPVDAQQRQSGFLIPDVSYTSRKGLIIGESVFLAFGRSADLTVGALYYSLRGYAQNGTFRYRGVGNDFFTAHFSALQDRGYTTPAVDANGNPILNKKGQPINIYTNQGGQDITAAFRYKFTRYTRAVGDVEYLSSYVYREAFTDSFNQAVSSDITSIGYLVRQWNGFSLDGRTDRYQGLKRVPVTLANGTSTAGQQVRIFHALDFDFTGVDHRIPGTPLLYSATASAAGLKRTQPNFVSSGIIERLDLRPELALPLAFAGWHTMSSVALEETFYSRSRKEPYGPNAVPIELTTPVNRASVEVKVDIRPPVVERTFQVPERWRWLLGDEVRHTIEPQIVYRNVHGVDNFLSVLRFDDIDLIADTDELEYGATQHLYFKPHPRIAKPKPGCPAIPPKPATSASGEAEADVAPTPEAEEPAPVASNDANGIPNASAESADAPTRNRSRHIDPCAASTEPPQREWFSWQVAQKHYFDPTFGGAVITTRRNLFDSTLNFSGIAFLTEPRQISPLISRMRFRSSAHTDVGWDFDYDTGASKFNSSNIFLEAHEGSYFGGFSFARLNAPGRFFTQVLDTNQISTSLVGSNTSDFSQMRVLLGYGNPAKPGLSLAGNTGLDLKLGSVQYATIQAGYNWNCCGIAVEYRKFELGSVRNENAYRFSFTLANIGTAGNLRRAERLF